MCHNPWALRFCFPHFLNFCPLSYISGIFFFHISGLVKLKITRVQFSKLWSAEDVTHGFRNETRWHVYRNQTFFFQVSSGKDDCSPWEQQLPFTKDCIYFSGKNACKLFLRSLMPVLGILDEGSFFSRACFCDGDRRVASSPGLRTEMTQGLWRCPISFPKSVNLHPHPLLLPPCF